ncbi:MAG: DUF4340 domain-containing protein [Oscillospiraceae bacterium]|nr:DUF4340 domain-containing protein [Oscillospiraceae bacterium]
MNRRTFIICAAAIVVLIGGIVFLMLSEDDIPPDNPSGQDIETSNPPSTLIQERDAAAVTVRPSGGSAFTILYDPASGEYELDTPNAVFPVRQSSLYLTHYYATWLTSLTCVTENADDQQLALFGLDDPMLTWSVKLPDGTSAEFALGGEQAAGNGSRYARRQNSREVFLLTSTQSDVLTRSLEDLYDLTFFPGHEEEGAWLFIQNVTIGKKDGSVIELNKRSDEELAAAELGSSRYRLMQPVVSETQEYNIEVLVMVPITTIVPESIEELHPADLSLYGLDAPDTLTYIEEDGESKTLLIGRADPERGGRYVMIEGHDAVLFDPNGDYRFLGTEATELRTRQIWLNNIKTVDSVDFHLEGVSRKLTFEHTFDDEDEDFHELRGWFDGLELSENNARRLYLAALRIMATGGTDAAVPAAAPDFTITMNFTEGGSDTMELYQLGGAQYLIVLNGVNQQFYISRMNLQNDFLGRIDMLDRGEDLPRL